MSTTLRKIRKRARLAEVLSIRETRRALADNGSKAAQTTLRKAEAHYRKWAYVHPGHVGTPLLDRASFYDLSERRQVRELEARGKWPKSARAQGTLLGKLAARRPERPEPTRIRGRR